LGNQTEFLKLIHLTKIPDTLLGTGGNTKLLGKNGRLFEFIEYMRHLELVHWHDDMVLWYVEIPSCVFSCPFKNWLKEPLKISCNM